eukprot:553757_1
MMFVNKPHKILLLILLSHWFDLSIACGFGLQSCDACYDASNNIICDCWCEQGCKSGGCPDNFQHKDDCYCWSPPYSNEKCYTGTCSPTTSPTPSPTHPPTQSPSLFAYSEDKE